MFIILKYSLYKFLTSLWERKIPKFFFVRWNRLLLWLAGAKVGRNCMVYNHVYITAPRGFKIFHIGNNVEISSGDGINPICRGQRAHIAVWRGASLYIGDNTGLSSPCIWCDDSITIGNGVKVGANCTILDTDCHSTDYLVRRQEKPCPNSKENGAKTIPVVIEDDVMIGCNVTILKGSTIGARSIIGANSVVTSVIPADCIAGGNPAKVIKYINK